MPHPDCIAPSYLPDDFNTETETVEVCAWCFVERPPQELREMYGDRVCPTCEAEAKATQKIAADLVRAMDLTRNAMRRAS